MMNIYQNHLKQQPTCHQPHFIRQAGIGHLLAFAMPVILLMLRLRRTQQEPDIKLIYEKAIHAIQQFDTQAKQQGYPPQTITAACYCLCVTFDEMILGTPWGSQSAWVQHTLLSAIHQETYGGERFYIILHQMAENPAENLDILELLYLLLSLGFEGQYFNENTAKRDEIRYSLFNLIRNYRESPQKALSPNALDQRVVEYHQIKKVPVWAVIVTAGIILLILASTLNIKSSHHAERLLDQLKTL